MDFRWALLNAKPIGVWWWNPPKFLTTNLTLTFTTTNLTLTFAMADL
jgi:hypothetical protein